MQQSRAQWKRNSAILLVVCCAGCGTRQYDERMRERLSELRSVSHIYRLLFESDTMIPGTNVSFRLPKLFDESSKSWATGSKNEAGFDIDVQRIQPPFAELPGFRFCYERFYTDSEGKPKVIYCYVAVIDPAESSPEEIMGTIQQDLTAKFPDAPEVWEDVEIATPDESTRSCKRTSVQGPQRFDLTPVGGPFDEFDGRLDLYLVSTDQQHILVGWRGTVEDVERTPLFQAGEASAGSIK